MGQYTLARDVHLCEIDDGAIVIDLNRGKYFAIDQPCVQDVRSVARDFGNEGLALREDFRRLSEVLTNAGIVSLGELACRPSADELSCPQLALAPGWPDDCSMAIGASQILHFTSAFVRARRAIRRNRIKHFVDGIQAYKAKLARRGAAPVDDAQFIKLTIVFRRLRLFAYTARDACLLDSLALSEFLCRHSLSPVLAFGVKTKPFGAHAWVQRQAVVLNDTVENVQQYTPILAV
jgi:hypothetical protein